MGDINLLPEEEQPRQRRKHSFDDSIEYTAGAKMSNGSVGTSQTNMPPATPAPRSLPSQQPVSNTLAPEPSRPRLSFKEWMARRKEEQTPEEYVNLGAPVPTMPTVDMRFSDSPSTMPSQIPMRQRTPQAPAPTPMPTPPVLPMPASPPPPVSVPPTPPFTPPSEMPPPSSPLHRATDQAPNLAHLPATSVEPLLKTTKVPVGGAQSSPDRMNPLRGGDGVNLLPKLLHAVDHEFHPTRFLMTLALVSVLAVLAVYIGLVLVQRTTVHQAADLLNESARLDEQLAAFFPIEREASAVEQSLQQMDALMQRHIYWTPFLTLLEEHTLPTVYYTSFNGSVSTGTFSFEAVASDFSQLDAQVQELRRSEHVEEVHVASATLIQSGTSADADTLTAGPVSFTMSVTIEQSVFHP